MISWAIASPVEFEFTSSSLSSRTFTAAAAGIFSTRESTSSSGFTSFLGTTNEDGQTFSATTSTASSRTFTVTSISPSTGVSSSSTSSSTTATGTTENTYIVTTSTETTTNVPSAATTATFQQFFDTISWTTSRTNTAKTSEIGFVTTFVPTPVYNQTDFGEREVTTDTTTTLNQTSTANAFDTVYQDSNSIIIVATELESNFVTINRPVSEFDSTTGTRVTLPHNIGTSSVRVVDFAANNNTEIPTTEESAEVTYEVTNQGDSYAITRNLVVSVIPNITGTGQAFNLNKVTSSASFGYVVGGYAGLNELTTTTSQYQVLTTRTNAMIGAFFDRYNDPAPPTFSDLFGTYSTYSQETRYPAMQTSRSEETVSQTIVSQCGGKTTAQKERVAELDYGPFVFDRPDIYNGEKIESFWGYGAVYKPYGILLEGQLVGAVSIAGTTLTGLTVGAVSRNNVYREFRESYQTTEKTIPDPFVNFYGNRLLLSYPDQSNDEFTLQGKSVTHTATTVSNQQTQTTTVSKEIVSMAASSVGPIGGRYWFGGEPEESATFYQTQFAGLLGDQTGGTSFFPDGGLTVIEHGQSEPLKYWQPILALGLGAAGGGIAFEPAYPASTYCFLAP